VIPRDALVESTYFIALQVVEITRAQAAVTFKPTMRIY
jgi:hypothetical protein